MRVITSLALAAAAVVIGVLALLWLFQERVAFQPQGPPYPAVTDVRRVEYRASDGQPLFAYVVGDPDTSPTLIAFHGNADLAAWQIDWARELAERTGYAVFLPEYRGYMGLPGRPSYRGIQRDARAAYQILTDSLGADRDSIAIFGHSLGSAVAVELAGEVKVAALLLQSPFTSSHDLARRVVTAPVASMWRFVSRVPYDTRRRVADVDVPVSVIHGARDQLLPAWMGRAVHGAAKVKGELLIVENAAHNDVGVVDAERYWAWIGRALTGPRTPPAPSPTR